MIRQTNMILYTSWADPGGAGGPDPLFCPRCRLFNIGPKVGPPPGPPLFLLVKLRWTHPLFKNLGSTPVHACTHTHARTHTTIIIHSCWWRFPVAEVVFGNFSEEAVPPNSGTTQDPVAGGLKPRGPQLVEVDLVANRNLGGDPSKCAPRSQGPLLYTTGERSWPWHG